MNKWLYIFLLFLLISVMVDNPGFWKAIINDAHYWIPGIVVGICVFYMIGRFIYLEKNGPIQLESNKSGDTYHVQSENGTAIGKVEQLIISDDVVVNRLENALIEQVDPLTFRVRPKTGKWNRPFVAIPFEEKNAITFDLNSANGMTYDVGIGVEIISGNLKQFGMICGLNGPVQNPATKDYYYTITFSKLPTYFMFGDYQSGTAYQWKQ